MSTENELENILEDDQLESTEPIEKDFDPYKISNLTRKIPNRFQLSAAIAKRARQLKEGARPMVGEVGAPPILTALNELQNDKFSVEILENQEEEETLLDDISEYLDSTIDENDPSDSKDTEKEDKTDDSDASTQSASKSVAS